LFDDAPKALDDMDGFNEAPLPRMKSATARRILVILHQAHSTPGRIGRLLMETGYHLDIRRPSCGDPLPKTMDAHDGVIIFGGPMSANDDLPWIHDEIDFIGKPLAAGKPFLGICLGAQMLARHLGHRVAPHPEGRVEVGYYPIRATEDGATVCPCAFPKKVYQWHREGFDLPTGATLLASGDDFEAQAFSYGRGAYGLQFHPEVTYAMMCKWTVTGVDRLSMPGALPRDMHLKGWYLHDAAVAAWLKAFLRTWARGGSALAGMMHQSPRATPMLAHLA
jgi:GMP synthase (glutamine-hydrolysing)